jgi:hypothetical protein
MGILGYFCSELNNSVDFFGEVEPKNCNCLSEEQASFAILAEQTWKIKELFIESGKNNPKFLS